MHPTQHIAQLPREEHLKKLWVYVCYDENHHKYQSYLIDTIPIGGLVIKSSCTPLKAPPIKFDWPHHCHLSINIGTHFDHRLSYIKTLNIFQTSSRVIVHSIVRKMMVLVEAHHLSTNVIKQPLLEVIGSIILMYLILTMKSHSQSSSLMVLYNRSQMDLNGCHISIHSSTYPKL